MATGIATIRNDAEPTVQARRALARLPETYSLSSPQFQAYTSLRFFFLCASAPLRSFLFLPAPQSHSA